MRAAALALLLVLMLAISVEAADNFPVSLGWAPTTSTTTTTLPPLPPTIDSCNTNYHYVTSGDIVTVLANCGSDDNSLDQFYATVNGSFIGKTGAMTGLNLLSWDTAAYSGNYSITCYVNNTGGVSNSSIDGWVFVIATTTTSTTSTTLAGAGGGGGGGGPTTTTQPSEFFLTEPTTTTLEGQFPLAIFGGAGGALPDLSGMCDILPLNLWIIVLMLTLLTLVLTSPWWKRLFIRR